MKQASINAKKDSKLKQTVRLLFSSYFEHSVGRNAAALAYYLLFALFPLLIFISNLLGLLHLDVASITLQLLPILPGNIVELLGSYLDYVSRNSNPVLLSFSLVA
ncbi:MAG: YihY/virulence factor BrkB family protein [Clostridia bacterium]|nr:YihY/virulence factor BrkB family protein [Clostridia bacterium]